MRILAFDLGSVVGVAMLDSERNEATTETIELYGKTRAQKLQDFRDSLEFDRVDVVAYERPHLRGWPATAMLVGMMGVLEVSALDAGITRIVSASTGEVKRFATAKWNASKEEVLAQMKLRFGDRLGWTTRPRAEPTDHEADAGALALFVEQGGGK